MAHPSQTIQAIAASPGIAIGRVKRVYGHGRLIEPQVLTVESEEAEAEIERFHNAQKKTSRDLGELQEQIRNKLNAHDADIFNAHILLVEDKMLTGEVEKRIRNDHFSAENAVYATAEEFARALSAVKDEYLRERAADVRDVAIRIQENLSDTKIAIGLDDRRIIIADNLTPSETARLDPGKTLGFAVEAGSVTSHTAILARSMKLPAVVGIPPELPKLLTADDKVIIDGYSGKLIVNPDARTEETYRLKAEAAGALYDKLAAESSLQPETTDGFLIPLAANIESVEAIADIRQAGASGVGLFRTEFLFMNRTTLPDEEEQFEVYKKFLISCEDQPVIIRTLDVGGDKFNTGVYHSFEANPFLGLRGIRICLRERRDIFNVQLRALLRAGVYGKLRVMLPMISCLQEVEEVRQIVVELQQQLAHEGKEYVSRLSLGVMVETPAAALNAERLAPLVDFFSIGTNDLVQYTMAIDRGNERVAYLYRPMHPAILELIRRCAIAARKHNIWVSVCGQAAADIQMVPLLVGLGVHELSMEPHSIALVRRVIRGLSMYEAEKAAREALQCGTADEVKAISEALVSRCAPEIAEL